MRRGRLAFGVVGLAAGCGYPELTPLTPLTEQISGVGTTHFVTDLVTSDVPTNFTMTVFESISQHGSTFDRRTGRGSGDGTFVVPVATDVASWDLGIGTAAGISLYLVGSDTMPDLSAFHLGRPDAAPPTAATVTTVNATGLVAWDASDDLEIVSSNAGAAVFSPQLGFATKPTTGATAISSQKFTWPSDTPLVDANKGDSTMMIQLAAKSGPDPYVALTTQGVANADGSLFTATNGQPATMTVALASVPQNKTLKVHWQRSDFDQLRSGAGPYASFAGASLALDALPGAATRGLFGAAPDLVRFSLADVTSGATVVDETFVYGNPFVHADPVGSTPTPWDELLIVSYAFAVSVQSPDATLPVSLSVGYSGVLQPTGIAGVAQVISPVISGVTNIRVAGKDASQSATGIGLTPLVTWSEPAIGVATEYELTLYSVTAVSGQTRLVPIAEFVTTETSLQIPDQVIAAGTRFVILISAVSAENATPSAPFELATPVALVTSVTAQLTP